MRVGERADVHDVVAQICRHMDVPNGFLQERKKERNKGMKEKKRKERKKGMKEKKRKERHLIRAATPALSFEDGWSLRRICIAQVSN